MTVLVEYLIVAGGGSGGSYVGGGGGGGGVLAGTVSVAELQNYTIAIGQGGAGSGSVSVQQSVVGNDGQPSSAFNLVALGGGGGGVYSQVAGRPGGSGGGGGGFQNGTGAGGSGTTGQGFNGGSAVGGRPRSFTGGGGGGGAGAVGGDSSNAINTGGDGGAGVSSSITGTQYFYGGGGGGGNYTDGARPGNGGIGGGGGGSSNTANVAGIGGGSTWTGVAGGNGSPTGDPNNNGGAGSPNTGGGGGGVGHYGLSGPGGSGVVILKYPDDINFVNPGNNLVYTTSTSVQGYKITTVTSGSGDVQFFSDLLKAIKNVSSRILNRFESFQPFVPVSALQGQAPYSYAISPALPSGLSFDSITGTISGSPTTNTEYLTYTVTITDAALATASNSFSLKTSTKYLYAVDLITNSVLTVTTVEAVDAATRQLGDIAPGELQIITRDLSTGNKETTPEVLSTITTYSDSYGQSFQNFYGALTVNVGTYTLNQQLYTTPGTYTWTVPSGVTSIAVAAIGGGGGGTQNINGGSGGSGGDLDYANGITVTAGQQISVTVGSGGATGADYGITGGDSYVTLPNTSIPVIFAAGGPGGDSIFWSENDIYYSGPDITGVFTSQTIEDPQNRTATYSISSGSLPTGFTLNSSTGEISYVSQSITNTVEHPPFTITASVSGQSISKQLALEVISVPGSGPGNPASSIAEIRSSGITTDGAYWFSTSKQPTPFQAYVKFNYIDGGDWYLLMKVHNQGDMSSGSTFWTNTTLNNETDWNLTSGSWSKYASWNGIAFTRLMMVMKQGGVDKVPPIMIFNTSRTFAEAITAAGGASAASAQNNIVRADSTDPAIATNATYHAMTMKSGTNFTDASGAEDIIQAYGISMWAGNSSNSTTAEGFSSTGRAGAWIGCPLDDGGHVFNNASNTGSDSAFGIGCAAGNPAKTTSAGYAEWTNASSTNTLPAYVWIR